MMMTGLRILLVVALGVALVSPATAKKPKLGVFGKINGKKFKAKSDGTPDDPCVFGTYDAAGGLTFTAGECTGTGDARAPREDFAQVLFFCGAVDPPKTPPFDAVCAAAAYAEAHIVGGQASDLKVWAATVSAPAAVRLRVQSFDGTYVKGDFSGVFDLPQQAGLPAAKVGKKVRFRFPVKTGP